MKKLLVVGFLFMVCAIQINAQTSGQLPFTAVTPPPPPVLTALGGLSPSGKIYTGNIMGITGTGFTSACVVNVDGIAQPTSTFVFSSATLINFTVPPSLGSSAGTSHTLTVTCAPPALTLNNPGTLPNARAGSPYTQNLAVLLQVSGGIPPYTWSLTSGALPTGLSLSPSGIVSGTPSGVGSKSFTVTVKDSSGLTIKKFTFDSKNMSDSEIGKLAFDRAS